MKPTPNDTPDKPLSEVYSPWDGHITDTEYLIGGTMKKSLGLNEDAALEEDEE